MKLIKSVIKNVVCSIVINIASNFISNFSASQIPPSIVQEYSKSRKYEIEIASSSHNRGNFQDNKKLEKLQKMQERMNKLNEEKEPRFKTKWQQPYLISLDQFKDSQEKVVQFNWKPYKRNFQNFSITSKKRLTYFLEQQSAFRGIPMPLLLIYSPSFISWILADDKKSLIESFRIENKSENSDDDMKKKSESSYINVNQENYQRYRREKELEMLMYLFPQRDDESWEHYLERLNRYRKLLYFLGLSILFLFLLFSMCFLLRKTKMLSQINYIYLKHLSENKIAAEIQELLMKQLLRAKFIKNHLVKKLTELKIYSIKLENSLNVYEKDNLEIKKVISAVLKELDIATNMLLQQKIQIEQLHQTLDELYDYNTNLIEGAKVLSDKLEKFSKKFKNPKTQEYLYKLLMQFSNIVRQYKVSKMTKNEEFIDFSKSEN
jgi:hypothetical protein